MHSIIKIKKSLHNFNYYLRIYISFRKKPKNIWQGLPTSYEFDAIKYKFFSRIKRLKFYLKLIFYHFFKLLYN